MFEKRCMPLPLFKEVGLSIHKVSSFFFSGSCSCGLIYSGSNDFSASLLRMCWERVISTNSFLIVTDFIFSFFVFYFLR